MNKLKALLMIFMAAPGYARSEAQHLKLNASKSLHLSNKIPVIWYENQEPAMIATLTVENYTAPENGSALHFEILQSADDDIKHKFRIDTDKLYALVTFNREETKDYFIPILVTDNGTTQRMLTILHVTIGDENDNKMTYGESKILVYLYEGQIPFAPIGRAYVEDMDDWDWSDKRYRVKAVDTPKTFALHPRTGMITMMRDARAGDYKILFTVTETSRYFPKHNVSAKVSVTVKTVSKEQIDNSLSIRFYGTAEQFLSDTPSLSRKDRLENGLAEIFNVTKDKVDVFTITQNPNVRLLDIRFSIFGESGYYDPQNIKVVIEYHKLELEELLGLGIKTIDINECMNGELRCDGGMTCINKLYTSDDSIVIYTNTSSFVGVNAFVNAECVCEAPPECLNRNYPYNDECECLEGYEGPICEEVTVGFDGHGYAMYEPIKPYNITRVKLEIVPQQKDGLVLYGGPLNFNPLLPIQDFFALELVDGLPAIILHNGSEAIREVQNKYRYVQGKPFTVEIVVQSTTVEMTVCDLLICLTINAPKGPNGSMNAPLQLGGSSVDLKLMGSMYNWTHIPQQKGFTGCLRNLTINGRPCDLGAPVFAKNLDSGCRRSAVVVSQRKNNVPFILAFMFSMLVLAIFTLVVIFKEKLYAYWQRRRMNNNMHTTIYYYVPGNAMGEPAINITGIEPQVPEVMNKYVLLCLFCFGIGLPAEETSSYRSYTEEDDDWKIEVEVTSAV